MNDKIASSEFIKAGASSYRIEIKRSLNYPKGQGFFWHLTAVVGLQLR
jgi:hypothetical protein